MRGITREHNYALEIGSHDGVRDCRTWICCTFLPRQRRQIGLQRQKNAYLTPIRAAKSSVNFFENIY